MREYGVDLLAVCSDGRNQSGKVSVCVRPGHEVYHRMGQQLVLQPLCHATQYSDYQGGVFLLFKAEHFKPPEYPLLGVVTDGAGIDEYERSVLNLVAEGISGLLKD